MDALSSRVFAQPSVSEAVLFVVKGAKYGVEDTLEGL
jgi:hypothetical protein